MTHKIVVWLAVVPVLFAACRSSDSPVGTAPSTTVPVVKPDSIPLTPGGAAAPLAAASAQGDARLELFSVDSHASPDADAILKALSFNLRSLAGCLASGSGGSAKGSIVADFELLEDGTAANATISMTTVKDSAVESCLLGKLVKETNLGRAGKRSRVTATYQLTPPKAPGGSVAVGSASAPGSSSVGAK